MCDDYHRLGFSHVIMDPGVKSYYDFEQTQPGALLREGELSSSNAPLSWDAVVQHAQQLVPDQGSSVAAAGNAIPAAYFTALGHADYNQVECCDLQPGTSYVDFTADCHRVDVMAHNYTADASQQ